MTSNSTRKKIFFVCSKEVLICPICGSRLSLRDHKKRIWKKAGGKRDWLLIERMQCTNENCRKLHNALPDLVVPHKHYESQLIEAVIDGVVTEDYLETEDYPCGMTMKRWRAWYQNNKAAAEGQIRQAADRFLDLKEEFLRSTESLLEGIRNRIEIGWLSIMLKILYNSGGRSIPIKSI